MTVVTCKGRTKDGKLCAAKPRPGTDLCPWHTPGLAEQRRQWSAKGGVNSSNKARARKELTATGIKSTDDLRALLSKAMDDVQAGTMEPGVLNALANAARTMEQLRETMEREQMDELVATIEVWKAAKDVGSLYGMQVDEVMARSNDMVEKFLAAMG